MDSHSCREHEHDGTIGRILRTLKSGASDEFTTEYEWDHRNRLVSVTFKDDMGVVKKTIAYDYDVFGRLVARTIDADGPGAGVPQTMFFVYDGDNALFEFLDTDASSTGDAALYRRNLYGPAVDQIMAFQHVSTWSVDWYMADHQGSVRDMVNSNGLKTNHIRYDAFGNVKSE